MMAACPMVIITGPTASGKTGRGVDVARAIGGEIISADSRQVYTGMDIGTGKDLDEYGDVPVHLIDVVPAGYKYNLFEYLRDANAALNDVRQRGLTPVVVGGTGLYVEALANGLNLPEVPANPALRESLKKRSLEELTEILASMKRLHNTTDVDTAQRAIRAIEIETYYAEHPDRTEHTVPNPVEGALIIGVDIPRVARRQRITTRLKHRLEQEDMLGEVKRLLDSGIAPEDLIYYGLEYKFLTEHLLGRTSYQEMFTGLETAIHQFAKRQMTWFRGMERRGHHIEWLPYDLSREEFTSTVVKMIETGNPHRTEIH